MHPGFSESCGLQGIFKRIGYITGCHGGHQAPADDVTGIIIQYR